MPWLILLNNQEGDFLSYFDDWCMPQPWHCPNSPWWGDPKGIQTTVEKQLKLPKVPGCWSAISTLLKTIFPKPRDSQKHLPSPWAWYPSSRPSNSRTDGFSCIQHLHGYPTFQSRSDLGTRKYWQIQGQLSQTNTILCCKALEWNWKWGLHQRQLPSSPASLLRPHMRDFPTTFKNSIWAWRSRQYFCASSTRLT